MSILCTKYECCRNDVKMAEPSKVVVLTSYVTMFLNKIITPISLEKAHVI